MCSDIVEARQEEKGAVYYVTTGPGKAYSLLIDEVDAGWEHGSTKQLCVCERGPASERQGSLARNGIRAAPVARAACSSVKPLGAFTVDCNMILVLLSIWRMAPP